MQPNGHQPIFILKEGTERSHGRVAQSNNISAAKAVAEAVRSTLGPKGMDKMLVDEGGDLIGPMLEGLATNTNSPEVLLEIAKTSLTGKSAGTIRDHLASMCVNVVESLGNGRKVDLEHLNVVKAVGGEASDSHLVNGIVIDKEKCHSSMPVGIGD
jgi:chaperonin GroEL (HSP60 family)